MYNVLLLYGFNAYRVTVLHLEMPFDEKRGMDVLLRMLLTQYWLPVGVLIAHSETTRQNSVHRNADNCRPMRVQPKHQEGNPIRPHVIWRR